MNWIKGHPPQDDTEKVYLLKFNSGIIASGRYRQGNLGEPDQMYKDWRCDCCGRFATPEYWSKL